MLAHPHLGLGVMSVLAALIAEYAVAQPCNPVIDGTYCASQPIRPKSTSRPTSIGMQPVQSIASDLSIGSDQPATFGAITFQGGGSRCIGLLRRGSCT